MLHSKLSNVRVLSLSVGASKSQTVEKKVGQKFGKHWPKFVNLFGKCQPNFCRDDCSNSAKVLSLERRKSVVSRPGNALKRRFSWFLDWIPNVQKCVNL